jgi:hypothetical protein
MKCVKKGVSLVFILLILLVPFISAQQVVQVAQEQPAQKTNLFSSAFGFLKSPIFWYIAIGLAILILVVIGLFFLVRWLVKFLKERSDIFWKLRTERIKLAKIQRRYPSKSWFKVEKNTPIRLVHNNNNHLFVSQPIAYHRGDYMTHEGNIVISMNLRNNKKWFILPITDLLVIPNREKMEITRRNDKGKTEKVTIENLPQAKDIVKFNEDEILIYAESLSNIGMFFVPVLKAQDGKIIDLSLPVYQSLKEVILGEYLYEQTDEFTKLAKKSMDINPNLRYQIKSGDTSSAVEVPQQQGK